VASRVLLISANQCSTPEVVFPLALAYLSAALHSAGHACFCYDVLASLEPLADIIQRFQPDLIGISIRNIDDVTIRQRDTFFGSAVDICAEVRRATRSPIVLGGSGFSIFPEELLELSGADYGIVGEGEQALLELLKCLLDGEDCRLIPGLVFRRDESVVINPARTRALGRNSTVADRPADLITHYLRVSGMLNLQTQRGCSFRCCYCTYPVVEGKTHRSRPAEAVAEEFAALERAGAKYVFIVDSVFNSSARHVREVCEAILKRGTKIAWGCFLRPHGLTPELMRLMAQAGLAHIEFGCDSFCDPVLKNYGKDFAFSDIQHSVRLAQQENVDSCLFLIAGGPGETPETLQTSFANSLKLGGSPVMAVVGMRVYPGTPLHALALRERCIEPEVSLLQPQYYLAPGLSAECVLNQLHSFARQSSNWIVGDPNDTYVRIVSRLRARGVVGPLWSYFSAIQRLWPAPQLESTAACNRSEN